MWLPSFYSHQLSQRLALICPANAGLQLSDRAPDGVSPNIQGRTHSNALLAAAHHDQILFKAAANNPVPFLAGGQIKCSPQSPAPHPRTHLKCLGEVTKQLHQIVPHPKRVAQQVVLFDDIDHTMAAHHIHNISFKGA